MSENTKFIENLKVGDVDKYNDFLNALKTGDSVAIWEGETEGYQITKVINATKTAICTQKYPSLVFHRSNGKSSARQKQRSYRYLYPADKAQLANDRANYEQQLFDLIKDAEKTTLEKFHECFEALEQILK